jgi:hypothetical protein
MRAAGNAFARVRGHEGFWIIFGGLLLCSASTMAQSWSPPAGHRPKGTNELSDLMEEPISTRHQIGVSADYLMGRGHLVAPVFFSANLRDPNLAPQLDDPKRESDFFGATLSYSFGQAWYLDLSYAHGDSSADGIIDFGGGLNAPATYELRDDWYQIYGRYTFPGLRGTRFSAYLRAGASFVRNTLDAQTSGAVVYSQENEYDDILGNVGFGLSYALFNWPRSRISLVAEGEGFYGFREQESTETITIGVDTLTYPQANIDNTLYGGLGRAAVRFEYAVGQRGTFNLFADAGGQIKYSIVTYDSSPNFAAQDPDELLWGPYVKLGLTYAF